MRWLSFALVFACAKQVDAAPVPTESCAGERAGRDEGDCFPALNLPDHNGAYVPVVPVGSLAVIDLSAMWCPTCQRFAPTLEEVALAEPFVRVVTVLYEDIDSNDPTPDDAATWRASFDLTTPVLADIDNELEEILRVRQRPTLIVVDLDGRIAWRNGGAVPADELLDAIEAAR